MSKLDAGAPYKQGQDRELDSKLFRYRKLRIWSGDAYVEALTEKEVDNMVELWRKDFKTPWKLLRSDVLTLLVG